MLRRSDIVGWGREQEMVRDEANSDATEQLSQPAGRGLSSLLSLFSIHKSTRVCSCFLRWYDS